MPLTALLLLLATPQTPVYEDFLAWEGRWRVMRDAETHAVKRIWGSGLPAPGVQADPAAAEAWSRRFLETHLVTVAPGVGLHELRLVSNVLSGGVRSVGYLQTKGGLVVDGAQISLRFKRNRMVALAMDRLQDFEAPTAPSRLTEREAVDRALVRVDAAAADGVEGPLLADGRRILRVFAWSAAPWGRWRVDVDLISGEVLTPVQTLIDADASIHLRVPIRRPGTPRVDVPATHMLTQIDGVGAQTDANGQVTWTGTTTATISTSVVGPYFRVLNGDSAGDTATFTAQDADTLVWDGTTDPLLDAQIVSFAAAHAARRHVLGIDPALPFLQTRRNVVVNMTDTVCNAFSDGNDIFFMQAGQGCENTGRLPDVVHHEYGHAVHNNALIRGVGSFDSALSEGGSDYLAATIVDDPGMGRGFFMNDQPLRHLDPADGEARWPEDAGESHVTGLIVGGALWDLRKALGAEVVDRYWYATFQRASDIFTAYVEVLISDDDDGDLANGTPNICLITEMFARHGIADRQIAGQQIGIVERDRFLIRIPVGDDPGLCPSAEVDRAVLSWDLRGVAGSGALIDMTRVPGHFEYQIPPQPEGQVLRFGVTLQMNDGTEMAFPNNAADPLYEAFIGEVTPIYCTDFETDPELDGWTHQMLEGSGRRPRDEWEWGPLGEGSRSGDPTTAYSGLNVVGQDLGTDSNGRYQRNKVEELVSPIFNVGGHQAVRLQYRRWLTVEDGTYDQAEIFAGGALLWTNLAGDDGETHHLDREWRFHDVDLTSQVQGDQVQVTYQMRTDDGTSAGGWTIDDLCIVGWNGPVAECGDGALDFGEICDDGNLADGDGCQADCTVTPMVPPPEKPVAMEPEPEGTMLDEEAAGCGCGTAGADRGSGLALLLLGVLFFRRRR